MHLMTDKSRLDALVVAAHDKYEQGLRLYNQTLLFVQQDSETIKIELKFDLFPRKYSRQALSSATTAVT